MTEKNMRFRAYFRLTSELLTYPSGELSGFGSFRRVRDGERHEQPGTREACFGRVEGLAQGGDRL